MRNLVARLFREADSKQSVPDTFKYIFSRRFILLGQEADLHLAAVYDDLLRKGLHVQSGFPARTSRYLFHIDSPY